MQMYVDPFGVNSQLKIMSGYRGIQQGISLQLSTCANPGQHGEHSSNLENAMYEWHTHNNTNNNSTHDNIINFNFQLWPFKPTTQNCPIRGQNNLFRQYMQLQQSTRNSTKQHDFI